MKRGKRNFSFERLEKREVFSATVIEVEVNDTKAQANAFELDSTDTTAELVGTSQNDDDKDWFRFTAPQNGTLTATVASPNNEIAALEVERPDGTEVMSTDPNDGINTASGEVVAGETLFVRLRAKDDAAADYVANLTLGDGGEGQAVRVDLAILRQALSRRLRTTTARFGPHHSRWTTRVPFNSSGRR